MAKIRFKQRFANNWEKGDVVEVVEKDEENYLVDSVAVISKEDIHDVAEFVGDDTPRQLTYLEEKRPTRREDDMDFLGIY